MLLNFKTLIEMKTICTPIVRNVLHNFSFAEQYFRHDFIFSLNKNIFLVSFSVKN